MTSDNITLVRPPDAMPELVLSGGKLTMADIAALTEHIRSLGADTTALLLRSDGADFCLGRAAGPHGSAATDADDIRRDVLKPILALYAEINSAPFPVIAAVRGRALGLGFAIAASCDVLLATEHATFALPEIEAGFAPLLVLSQLVHLMPKQLLFHLSATADPISGLRLWQTGLVSQLVDEDKLDHAAREISQRLAHRPPVRDIKAFLAQRINSDREADAAYAAHHLGAALAGRQ